MTQGPRFEKLVQQAKERIQQISPAQAAQKQSAGAVLIDVREADDYAKGHAADAIGLSKGLIELKIEQLVPDVATPVICYCGGGSRSALAVAALQDMGYGNAASMIGGFKAWQNAGLPIDRE